MRARSPTSSMLLATTIFFSSLALAWMRQWHWALVACMISLVVVCWASNDINEQDKLQIRFGILAASDVLRELQEQHEVHERIKVTGAVNDRLRSVTLAALDSLALKFNRAESKNDESGKLALICQEAAYLAFRENSLSNDDVVLSSALSLLALIAKQPKVRERCQHVADLYGLSRPIYCIQRALMRSHDLRDPDRELVAAELQRKACLFLGALADGDADVAKLVVQENGLEAILDALDWFRCHREVVNWGLWACFILCFEHAPNKQSVVARNGIATILVAMGGSMSTEVARHGIATLFNLLRDDPHMNVYELRKAAVRANMHGIVLMAMKENTDALDIIMMGQELLAGSDYNGNVPQFEPR